MPASDGGAVRSEKGRKGDAWLGNLDLESRTRGSFEESCSKFPAIVDQNGIEQWGQLVVDKDCSRNQVVGLVGNMSVISNHCSCLPLGTHSIGIAQVFWLVEC